MKCAPLSRKDNIVIQEVDDEILIYDLIKNKAFCLNKTSAMVWQECDGTKTVDEISRAVSKKAGEPVSEDIVWLALSQFKSDKLLEKNNSLTTPFDGLTRREVVKRIGFATTVALPMIAGVVAPSAVNAQSVAAVTCGCPAPSTQRARTGGCSCNANSDCCTNSCSFAIPNVFGLCTAGTASGATPCCSAVACAPFGAMNGIVQPGCRCAFVEDCISGVCGGAGATPVCGA